MADATEGIWQQVKPLTSIPMRDLSYSYIYARNMLWRLRAKTTKTNAHGKSQGRPVTQQVTPMNNNDEHETMDERDGNLGPHTTSIFAEFLNGWRNLRPNGAMSNDAAERRPQRKLDVLSWGFGE